MHYIYLNYTFCYSKLCLLASARLAAPPALAANVRDRCLQFQQQQSCSTWDCHSIRYKHRYGGFKRHLCTKEINLPVKACVPIDNSEKLVFSSLALELGGGVTDKIKAKVWANEYVDFGLLVSVTPSPDRYSISINTSTPSSGAQLLSPVSLRRRSLILINGYPHLILSLQFT